MFPTHYALKSRFGEKRYSMIGLYPFRKLLTGAKSFTAVYHRHGRANLGEVKRVFGRGIASADDADIQSLVQIPIACGRFDDTPPDELFFARYPKLAPPDSRCQNDYDRPEVLAAAKRQMFGLQVNALDFSAVPKIEIGILNMCSK